jgi:hypothetical protein
VQLFPSVLAGAGGWPQARLVLFGPDAGLVRALAALRVSATVPVAPDEITARRLLDQRARACHERGSGSEEVVPAVS